MDGTGQRAGSPRQGECCSAVAAGPATSFYDTDASGSLMQLSDLQPKRPSGLGRLGAFCTTQGRGRGRESH